MRKQALQPDLCQVSGLVVIRPLRIIQVQTLVHLDQETDFVLDYREAAAAEVVLPHNLAAKHLTAREVAATILEVAQALVVLRMSLPRSLGQIAGATLMHTIRISTVLQANPMVVAFKGIDNGLEVPDNVQINVTIRSASDASDVY